MKKRNTRSKSAARENFKSKFLGMAYTSFCVITAILSFLDIFFDIKRFKATANNNL